MVVGAGIGGLVAALLLARRGARVQLLEAAATPGGKMRQQRLAGLALDAGPTVLTLRWIFEHIFEAAGSRLADHVTLTPLDVLARHAWGADVAREQLDLHADQRLSSDAIARFAGPAEARRFDAFCAEARRVYRTLEGPYLRSQRPSVAGMVRALGPRGLAQLTALGPLTSLASLLTRRFADPRLRQLFGRYATYCGSSPATAPATLMLVAQVEMDGVWAVQGGMHALAQALAALAVQQGVEIDYGVRVSHISRSNAGAGRVDAVHTACGRQLPADAVVFNGDADALAHGLLGAPVQPAVPPRAPRDRSLSALTAAVVARTAGFELSRHNVFFHAPHQVAGEFDDVFERGRLPERGTVYVCAQDRSGRAAAAATNTSCTEATSTEAPGTAAPERLLVLVNAPPNGDTQRAHAEDIARCERSTHALLTHCGLQLHSAAQDWQRTTPQDFERLFPASGGSLYGTATRGWMALFRRPGSSTAVPGLFLAGGSVHPGPGVPMAAMSGVLAAEALMAHLASTRRLHPVATAGGTSTPSATAAGTG